MPKQKQQKETLIDTYTHRTEKRTNNPQVGLVSTVTDKPNGKTKYEHDPHIDPYLSWAGKKEKSTFEVQNVSLHIHERIDPSRIVKSFLNPKRKTEQLSLFEEPENDPPLDRAIHFYQHEQDWTNRLIAGDSLLVMNSLLVKEGMAGKVQMVYFDPPYGIKYNSNFQPFVNKRDVKDGNDADLPAEPEMIQAFRDTWELGIHSYLTYLRDRLLLVRELLHESGSVFVQISDENVHRVRCVMDEVFGAENFVSEIVFSKGVSLGTKGLSNVNDFLLWYTKNNKFTKYYQLFEKKEIDSDSPYSMIMFDNGRYRRITEEEKVSKFRSLKEQKIFRYDKLTSAGYTSSCYYDFNLKGKKIKPGKYSWKTNLKGMQHLIKSGRIHIIGENSPQFVYYYEDFPVIPIKNLWNNLQGASEPIYVVQTSPKVIQRCMLMTTDPGDLVLDITCGSGTTAYVAEQWGRRWITCDTSRVAITLAKQRLMTAKFDYYELAYPEQGIKSGFKYQTVPHITLGDIANNPEIDVIYEKMHPKIEKALKELNLALKGNQIKYKVTNGGREGNFVDFSASDKETFTMPSGEVVKVNELVEWEVPFEFPENWLLNAKKPFEAFHKARLDMQKEMDDSISRNAKQEVLYDKPFIEKGKVRVTGPFTVEAVPSLRVRPFNGEMPKLELSGTELARTGETIKQEEWREELKTNGIRTVGGKLIEFNYVEPMKGTQFLHARAEVKEQNLNGKLAYISFGPDYAPLEPRQVEKALEEANKLKEKPNFLIFAAFHFDPEASKDIDEIDWKGVTILKAQMSVDLLTSDLRKKRASNQSYWLIGQPDVEVKKQKDGRYIVKVNGFDYYNPVTGEMESKGASHIAMWMLDTDYDDKSLMPDQVFFPEGDEKRDWTRLAKALKAELNEEALEKFRGTESLPFTLGANKKIAVKIIDNRGIESFVIKELG